MKQKGFTFVETVFAVSIFLIVTLSVYEGYRWLYASLSLAHLKVVAASLVNERFEIARNLPYTDVGLVGGNPVGKLIPNQVLVRDGISWNVTTLVENIDDEFDGVSPADTRPADYKLVEVTVACVACKDFAPVTVSGWIAPRNIEP